MRLGFWKRVLTPVERTFLYNAGAGRSYPFSTALDRYPNQQSDPNRLADADGHPDDPSRAGWAGVEAALLRRCAKGCRPGAHERQR